MVTMRHVNDSRRWGLLMGTLALGTTVLGTSCLQVNTGHCMFAGGDIACGDAAFCVGAVGGRSDAIASADSQGCIDALPAEGPSWVHVEYGLPTAVLMRDANGAGASTATVEGIVTRVLEDRGFAFDASKTECQERLEEIGDLTEIHRRILSEDGGRASVNALTFGEAERERIVAFNEDIAAALGEFETECSVENATTGTSTGLDTTATEDTGSTTDPLPCTSHDECTDPDAPFCGVSGECGTCDGTEDPNGACAERNPGLPICDEGACVQCTPENPSACTGETPVCDGAMNTCTGCTAHEQCGEAACNLFTGACLPADTVVHVGPGQTFTTLGGAVASFGPEAEGTIIVHITPLGYNEAVLVGGGRVLAFLADEEAVTPPRWLFTGGNSPQLTVGPGSTVLMDGLQISTNASAMPVQPGVSVSGRAWIDRSRIIDNNGGGIISQSGSELMLRSSFVGGDVNDLSALVVNGATASISYSTLGGGFGAATALTCDIAATVTARNSLFVARTDEDEILCDAAIETSAAELDLGDTNTPLGNMATAWFTNYASGDFGLTAMHPPAIDSAALWRTGDPTTDIDGDPRPTTDATPDFAGADVP